eukprot:Nitzschia sp. Nitz4//scaffold553_size3221//599//2159//NITZ4_009274-RA/size3221-snap-gene-0.0-mRNA-1//-1//CDS//3329554436//4859//frame0
MLASMNLSACLNDQGLQRNICPNIRDDNDHESNYHQALNLAEPEQGLHSSVSKYEINTNLVSDALHSMSVQERDQVFNEMHGVDDTVVRPDSSESAEFLASALAAFDVSLMALKTELQGNPVLTALLAAEQMNSQYVQDPQLRLAFLRTREWNSNEAALCFIRHFDFKFTLFGGAKLTKSIAIEDLSPADLNMLSEGYFQVLPSRDRAGRAIMVWINDGQQYESPISLARQMFYMAAIDEETQRCGCVNISFRLAPYTFANRQATEEAFPLMFRCHTDMPVRYVAFHECLKDGTPTIQSRFTSIFLTVVQLFKKNSRARVRCHYGTYTEWCYNLISFGIPVHLLPLTLNGGVKNKSHLEYLGMCHRAVEASKAHLFPILLPSNGDVLLGKGRPMQRAAGNQKLSELIESLLEEREKRTSAGKAALAADVVRQVKISGGKFLSKDQGVWLEVSDAIARDKVSHMFRHRRGGT